jgi:hypothetical protein
MSMLKLLYYPQQRKMVLICKERVFDWAKIRLLFVYRYDHLAHCIARLLTDQPRKIK